MYPQCVKHFNLEPNNEFKNKIKILGEYEYSSPSANKTKANLTYNKL